MPKHEEHRAETAEDLDLDPPTTVGADGVDLEVSHRTLEELAGLIDPDVVKRGDITTLEFADGKRLSFSIKALDTPELRRTPKGAIIEQGHRDPDDITTSWEARKTDDKDGWNITNNDGSVVQYDTEIAKLIYCTPAALGAYVRELDNEEKEAPNDGADEGRN